MNFDANIRHGKLKTERLLNWLKVLPFRDFFIVEIFAKKHCFLNDLKHPKPFNLLTFAGIQILKNLKRFFPHL